MEELPPAWRGETNPGLVNCQDLLFLKFPIKAAESFSYSPEVTYYFEDYFSKLKIDISSIVTPNDIFYPFFLLLKNKKKNLVF